MAKHNEITDENTRYQIFQGHVDCTLAANAQNLSCSLKVNEFAASVRAAARERVTVDSACNDELTDTAFAFAENNGLCTEASYSYTGAWGLARIRAAL